MLFATLRFLLLLLLVFNTIITAKAQTADSSGVFTWPSAQDLLTLPVDNLGQTKVSVASKNEESLIINV